MLLDALSLCRIYSLHGGPEGKGWSYLKLDEPIPNPLMEEPIRRLLGLTEGQLQGVMAGTETLAGRRGSKAIQAALESLDLGALEEADKAAIVPAKRNRRDEAVRRLSFISGLRKSGLSPADLMITKVPVPPPTFHSVGTLGSISLIPPSEPEKVAAHCPPNLALLPPHPQ